METSSLTFAQPAWFYALLIIPAVAGLYLWAHNRSRALVAKIVAPRLRSQLAGAVSVKLRVFKAILVLLAFAAIIVTLARPQMGFKQMEVQQTGRDIIIAIDTSRSMLATDVTPTRLARAKLVAQDLMRLVHGDRIGLIAFAGSSFLQAPLTLDYGAVQNSLNDLDTNVIPKGGTNIASAIDTAIEAFGKGEGQSRALIILTDGEELDADGIAAARKAAEAGIHIFTIGIGSAEGSLIPIKTDRGQPDFVRDANNNPVQSKLDEARLKEIAEAGKGFYEHLSPEVANSVFQKGIVPMSLTEKGAYTSRQPVERYQVPLGIAIALLALWLILGERRRASAIRRAAAGAALFILSSGWAHAASGYEDMQAGQYNKALSDFERRLQENPNSEKVQFDAGVAAYKLGDYGKAVDHFTKGLLAEDQKLREDASYNLGNALVRRGEGAKGNDEKKADWKNAIQHYTEALNIDPKNKNAQENRDLVKKLLEELEKQEKQQQDQKNDQQQNQDKKDNKDQKQDQQKNQQNQQNQQQNKDQQKQDQKNDQQQNKQDQKNQQDKQDKQNNKDQQGNDQKNGQDQQKKDQPDKPQDKNDKGQQDKDKQDKQDQAKNDNKDQQKKDQGQDQKDKDQSQPNQPKDQDQQKNQGQPQDQEQQQDQKQQSGSQPTPQPTPGEKKQGELKDAQPTSPDKQEKEGQAAQPAEESKDGEMSATQAKSLLNSLRSEEAAVRLMQQQETQETLKDW